jgi:hypothetical protein
MDKSLKFFCLAIKQVKVPVCAYPKISPFVFINTGDRIVTDRRTVCKILKEMNKGVTISIVQTQATTSCTNPKISEPVFINCIYYIRSETRFILWVVFVQSKLIAIVFVQSVLCSKPHEAILIF